MPYLAFQLTAQQSNTKSAIADCKTLCTSKSSGVLRLVRTLAPWGKSEFSFVHHMYSLVLYIPSPYRGVVAAADNCGAIC